MKLQLDNKTLNAYINEALKQELNENNMDELFGSRVRKQSRRMITGQGWGNQRRETGNLWGDANTTIDTNSDAEMETPQTLVGMIIKMERALKEIESTAGIESYAGSLSDDIKSAGNLKKTLLAAIKALTQIAGRVNKIERISGSNSIMENVERDATGYGLDAAAGGNAVIGNTLNMHDLTKAQRTHGINTSFETNVLHNAQYKNTGYGALGNKITPQKAEELVRTGKAKYLPGKNKIAYLNNLGKQTTVKSIMTPDEMQTLANMTAAQGRNAASTEASRAILNGKNINMGTGFWGKQVANVKNSANQLKTGAQTIKNAGRYGKTVASKAAGISANAAKVGKAARTGQIMKGMGQIASGVGRLSQLPLLLFSIADEAGRQAAQGRQRNVVRTYNAAAVIAKRLGNIAQDIADAGGGATEDTGVVTEINVHRGMKSFDSIESGMQELSNIMRQIGGVSQGTAHNRIVEIPEGLDLNTRKGVLVFQQWVNSIPIADANGNPLTEDGIFGRNTNYVYNRIAQMLQQQGQSQIREGIIKESKAIETALANLERAAGATGSGGNAYSSIGAMSGGANASRLQNAQNIKNIIRTYPPVLNQYLNILSDAGADVSTLQPLNVDTRPHRNYSVKELQAIDKRIQELLQITRNVEIPEREDSEGGIIIKGTLPPKPIRKPKPKPTPNPTQPEDKTRPTDIPLESPDTSKMNLPGGASQLNTSDLKVNRPQPTLAQNTVSQMVKTATANPGTASQREKNTALRQQRDNALNTIKSDSYAGDKKGDTKFVKDAYRNIRRGNNHPTLQENKLSISEKELQAYINEAIKQEIENIK